VQRWQGLLIVGLACLSLRILIGFSGTLRVLGRDIDAQFETGGVLNWSIGAAFITSQKRGIFRLMRNRRAWPVTQAVSGYWPAYPRINEGHGCDMNGFR